MSTKTTNLGLDKPQMSDTLGTTIPQLANNFDVIDSNIASNTTQLAQIAINVKNYGAKGDGVTDDTTAIQNAINYAVNNNKGIVFFPNGTYLITQPLNLTLLGGGTKSLTLQGTGMGDTGGTILLGHTSGVMVDITGSQYITVKDMQLQSDTSSNASTVGILFGRSTVQDYCQFNNVENVKISLPNNKTKNGGNGTVGIYNNGGELHRYRNIIVIADCTVMFVLTNMFNITSTYTTTTANGVSMSECVIDGSSSLLGYGRSCVIMDYAVNIKFDNIYCYPWLASTGANGNMFAFELWNACYGIDITGHIEGYIQFIAITGMVQGLNVNVTKQNIAIVDQIVLFGNTVNSGINGGKINYVPTYNETMDINLISQTGTMQNGVYNTEITLYKHQKLNIPYGYTTGNTIRVEDESTSTITLSGAGYNNGTMIQERNNTFAMGDFSVGGYFQTGWVSSLPTASATYENKIIILEGNGTTTASIAYICLKSVTGTFSWKQLVSG